MPRFRIVKWDQPQSGSFDHEPERHNAEIEALCAQGWALALNSQIDADDICHRLVLLMRAPGAPSLEDSPPRAANE